MFLQLPNMHAVDFAILPVQPRAVGPAWDARMVRRATIVHGNQLFASLTTEDCRQRCVMAALVFWTRLRQGGDQLAKQPGLNAIFFVLQVVHLRIAAERC